MNNQADGTNAFFGGHEPFQLIYLDSNVLNHFFSARGRDLERKFIEILQTEGVRIGKTVHFAITPFVLLERLGITLKNDMKFEFDRACQSVDNNPRRIYEVINSFYNQARVEISGNPELSRKTLLERCDERLKYIPSSRHSDFRELFHSRCRNDGYVQHIFDQLAWDSVFKFSPPLKHELTKTYQIACLLLALEAHRMKMPISFFRAAKEVWEVIKNHHIKKSGESILSPELQRIQNAMKLKKTGDLVDGELVHYLCVGGIVSGNCKPVVGATMDAPADIEGRVKAYIYVLHETWELAKAWGDQKGISIPGITLQPGIALCLRSKSFENYKLLAIDSLNKIVEAKEG